jgi:hypothetical protein
MKHERDIRIIRLQLAGPRIFAGAVGVVALGLLLWGLWDMRAADNRLSAIIRVAIGGFLVLDALLVWFVMGAGRRKLLTILESERKRPMFVTLEAEHIRQSPRRRLWATLRQSPQGSARWKLGVQEPIWELRPLLDDKAPRACEVYLDPATDEPAIIELPEGLLWRHPGPGTVQRLEGAD